MPIIGLDSLFGKILHLEVIRTQLPKVEHVQKGNVSKVAHGLVGGNHGHYGLGLAAHQYYFPDLRYFGWSKQQV